MLSEFTYLTNLGEEHLTKMRFERDLKDDLKAGLDALYEFAEKLNQLHPEVTNAMSRMLQEPRYGI